MTTSGGHDRLLLKLALCAALAVLPGGCGPDYSPNTYASSAVQQANKVDQGVLVGVREVGVSASGTAGAVVGGAAGGIAGAQVGKARPARSARWAAHWWAALPAARRSTWSATPAPSNTSSARPTETCSA